MIIYVLSASYYRLYSRDEIHNCVVSLIGPECVFIMLWNR
jgi:hypothetical protein